eukprot:g6853.t1
MFSKICHGHVFITAPKPRTFHKQLTMRARSATRFWEHVFLTHSADIKSTSRRTETNLASVIREYVTQIGEWWQPTKEAVKQELTIEEMTLQLQVMLPDLDELERSVREDDISLISAETDWPNICRFLQPVSIKEIQKSRFMATLSHVSYCLSKWTDQNFFKRYGLQLVTTSLKIKQPAKNAAKMESDLNDSDGMTVATVPNTQAQKQDKRHSQKQAQKQCRKQFVELSNIVSVSSIFHNSITKNQSEKTESHDWNSGSQMNTDNSHYLRKLARQIAISASAHRSAVSFTLTRVMHLLQRSLNPVQSPLFTRTPPVHTKCPTEWFVCDDATTETRIFCIQGSDNFESWRTNLQFDPVVFEEAELGVRVHRGIYEAALSLYDLFVPLIRDHVSLGSHKKISFTGHSLGGAIATVLFMILVHRGMLEAKNVGQVFTFGGAACFCDAFDCSNCVLSSSDSSYSTSNQNLLEKLNLPTDTVVNIIMHKDIIPRAFAADYSLLAVFLRNWSSSFRTHHCLVSQERALLYNFIGEVFVLQPEAGVNFVRNEGYHPMLPKQPGLFRLADPDQGDWNLASKLKKERSESGGRVSKSAYDKQEAFLALMDHPHPLDILSETRAYGESGAISRYHNPFHYVLGLRSAITRCKQTS